MSLWPAPDAQPSGLVERARKEHERRVGAQPAHVASAPATWILAGENVDHFGGATLIGLGGLRASVAVSPRDDHKLRFAASAPGSEPVLSLIHISEPTRPY